MKKKIKDMYAKEFQKYLESDKAEEFRNVMCQTFQYARPISIYKKLLKLIKLFEQEVEIEVKK